MPSKVFILLIPNQKEIQGQESSRASNILIPYLLQQRYTNIQYHTRTPCIKINRTFHSFQFSHSVVFYSLPPHGLQHTSLPVHYQPRVYSNSCPMSWWCHPTISSSVVPFSSCLQFLPGSGSFPMSQLFASGGQSTGLSASESVLPINIQDWFPLGLTSWISLQSKGLSRVLSNTTVQKHQFYGAQLFHSPTLTSMHDHRKNHSLD